MSDLEYTRDGTVATVLLNRPDQRNAFTLAMIDEWVDALVEADTDARVHVVVLRGAGNAFCAGVDLGVVLDEMGETAIEQKEILRRRIQRIPRLVETFDKPLIASIAGVAVGAGLDMALMCDMRIAGRSARLGETYVKAGLVPGAGGCYYLPRLVGPAKAFELLMTGDLVDAETALEIGLVNHVYDDDALLRETYTFAERIASAPPDLLGLIKRTLYQSAVIDLRTSLELVSSHMGVVRSTDESKAALAQLRATILRQGT